MQRNSLSSQTGYAGGPIGLPGGSGGGMLDLIESHDFGSAATSVTFSGLDGDTDEVYFLSYKIVKAVAGATHVDMQPNSITTGQQMDGRYDGTGPASGVITAALLRFSTNGGGGTGDVDFGSLWLAAETGFMRVARFEFVQAISGGNVYAMSGAMKWTDTSTNITSIAFVCNQANGIGAGSFIRLYRLLKA